MFFVRRCSSLPGHWRCTSLIYNCNDPTTQPPAMNLDLGSIQIKTRSCAAALSCPAKFQMPYAQLRERLQVGSSRVVRIGTSGKRDAPIKPLCYGVAHLPPPLPPPALSCFLSSWSPPLISLAVLCRTPATCLLSALPVFLEFRHKQSDNEGQTNLGCHTASVQAQTCCEYPNI